MTVIQPTNRAKRLKAATTQAHEAVDTTVMSAQPFASREKYERFLRFQYRLHRNVEPLYAAPALQSLLPELADRSRLDALEQDFADLGFLLPLAEAGPDRPLAEALGWLYVVEGSNMGAAFLAKEAANIGLSEEFGARHLAGHADGRGLHWCRFTAGLDAVSLTEDQEKTTEAAATAAFNHVLELVRQEMFDVASV